MRRTLLLQIPLFSKFSLSYSSKCHKNGSFPSLVFKSHYLPSFTLLWREAISSLQLIISNFEVLILYTLSIYNNICMYLNYIYTYCVCVCVCVCTRTPIRAFLILCVKNKQCYLWDYEVYKHLLREMVLPSKQYPKLF